jgi:hypothetical protein
MIISLISHGLRESSLSILASNSYIYKQKPKTTKKTTTRDRTKSLPYHYSTPFSPHIPFLQLKSLPLGQKKKKKKSYRKDVFHSIFLLTLNTSITSIISLKFKNPQWEQTWQAGIRHSLFVFFSLANSLSCPPMKCPFACFDSIFRTPFAISYAFYEPFSLTLFVTLVVPSSPCAP